MFTKYVWKVLVIVVMALSIVGVVAAADVKKADVKKADVKKADATKDSWTPTKPVTMVLPYSAGGSSDLLARAVEKVWSKYSPQPVTIVYKTGGGGVVGSRFVANSKPDGYTLLIAYGSGCDIVMPHLEKMEYNPFTDLEPVARLSVHSVLIVVPANSKFNTIKDVVDYAKKENWPITASVSTTAGAVDLVMRGFGKAAGIKVVSIPHSGGSQAITTLVGGHTMIGGGHPAEVISQLKAGRIKGIGIATPKRDPALPDVPTLEEQGVNFHTWGSVKGIAVPKNTSKEIIAYYGDLFKKITDDPEFKKIMQDMLQPIQYQGPDEFKKFIRLAYDDYGKLIKELGIDKELKK